MHEQQRWISHFLQTVRTREYEPSLAFELASSSCFRRVARAEGREAATVGDRRVSAASGLGRSRGALRGGGGPRITSLSPDGFCFGACGSGGFSGL